MSSQEFVSGLTQVSRLHREIRVLADDNIQQW
jgi:hypothetical protein